MDLLNFGEWLLKHFNVRIPDNFNSIFFNFKGTAPKEIRDFDTYQSWGYFYSNIICKMIKNRKVSQMSNLVVTLQQLVNENKLWEKLYYTIGKNFFLFFFLQCEIYFKWGKNTYILLSDINNYTNPEKPFTYQNENSSLPSIYTVGFDQDVPIKIHRILYINCKKNLKHIISKKPITLKTEILSQFVGPEISKFNSFGARQMKSLITLIKHNPTLKDCKLMLNEIVHEQDDIIPVQKVILLLTKTIETFIPYKLLVKRNYLKRFLKNMQFLLKFSLKQKITLGFVMNGIAENMDPLKRNTIAKVIMWLINKFIVKIIRSLFYVSVADKGHSMIFIKQQFWLRFQKMAICQMITDNQLLKVYDTNCSKQMKKIKFCPKFSGSGFRPVVTSSKFDKDKLELCNIFLKQLIASRRKNLPNPSKELHSSWLNYAKSKNKNLQYYYVKTDIKDAYGSIIHDKLKHILEKWFDGIKSNLTVTSFEFKGKWGKLETLQQFIDLPSSCGEKVLIYKYEKEKLVSLCELKSQIFDYIDDTYILFSRKKYQMIKGLPQGGKLSAALCEIYYTSFDQDYLSSLCNISKGEILLRAVDDYIFISHNQNKIHKFLSMMSCGIPEYGMEIQNDKTVTNLYDFNGTEVYYNSYIRFFGYNLDVNSCFITPDLHNYNDMNVQSSITFNKLDKGILLQKMSSAIALKLHPLLFDHAYQSIRTMIFNIHCASCVMALKYSAIVHFLKLAKVQLEEKFLMRCIEKATHSIASNIYRKALILGNKTIEYSAAKKVCFKSFILILERKKHYFKILRMLELKASRLNIKSKRIKHIIKAVVKVMPPDLS